MSERFKYLEKIGNDGTGYLSFFESGRDISFEIKRIYYIYDVPINEKRGMHAHKKLQQILWCPAGEVEVILDDGNKRVSYLLNSPEKTLLIEKGYWRDIYFREQHSVLCVAVSDYYNENDYIRDYSQFIEYVEKGYWND